MEPSGRISRGATAPAPDSRPVASRRASAPGLELDVGVRGGEPGRVGRARPPGSPRGPVAEVLARLLELAPSRSARARAPASRRSSRCPPPRPRRAPTRRRARASAGSARARRACSTTRPRRRSRRSSRCSRLGGRVCDRARERGVGVALGGRQPARAQPVRAARGRPPAAQGVGERLGPAVRVGEQAVLAVRRGTRPSRRGRSPRRAGPPPSPRAARAPTAPPSAPGTAARRARRRSAAGGRGRRARSARGRSTPSSRASRSSSSRCSGVAVADDAQGRLVRQEGQAATARSMPLRGSIRPQYRSRQRHGCSGAARKSSVVDAGVRDARARQRPERALGPLELVPADEDPARARAEVAQGRVRPSAARRAGRAAGARAERRLPRSRPCGP